MVGDPFLISGTSPSFWHLAQDVWVYVLQELQCKDFLAVMKENHPCIEKKYQVMKWHILMKRWLTAIAWTEEDSGCLPKVSQQQRCYTCTPAHTRQPLSPTMHSSVASTFAAITPLCKALWIISSSCDWCKLLPHQDVLAHCLRPLLNTWKMMLCHSQAILTL